MMFIAALATLFLSAASASPVTSRGVSAEPFIVRNFTTGTVARTGQNFLEFNLLRCPDPAFTTCHASLQGHGVLESIPFEACHSPWIYFKFTVNSGKGAELVVWWLDRVGGRKGRYTIPEDQLPFQGEGDGVHQAYNGPANFTITDTVERDGFP